MSDHRIVDARFGRRAFLKGILATAGLAACGGESYVYDPMQIPKPVQGYRGLAQLPFFELKNGRLVNVVKDFPRAIDFHGHLGFSVGKLEADLTASNDMQYLIDCDAEEDCHMDMEVYLNQIATKEMLDDSEAQLIKGPLTGKGKIVSHTVPNYVAELDEMKFDSAVLLPLKLNLAFPDTMEQRWRDAVAATGNQDRFHFFTSVHPAQKGWEQELEAYKAAGGKGVKFHPTMQRMAPNSDEGMAVIEKCDQLGLHVFFHAGRAGIEPGDLAATAALSNYDLPLHEFPNTTFIFGHSGARDWEEAAQRGREHDIIIMEFAGPSLAAMQAMLVAVGPDRLVFGSDWPFYPIAATLAKVLHLTGDDHVTRDKILEHNARRLLDLA